MLYKQTIRAGEVREINKSGRQIKIINCESTLQLRVFLSGKNLLETEVRSGFDVAFAKFDKLTIQSDQEQRIEVWASDNPLGYEAPTKGSNSNRSELIEHYGGSQKVLPFERNRVAITLFSDTEPFWYGGQGVTAENGIPVAAGVAHKIEGAGELHIAINKTPVYDPVIESVTTKSIQWSSYGMAAAAMDTVSGIAYLSSEDDNGALFRVTKDGVFNLRVIGEQIKAGGGFAYAAQYKNEDNNTQEAVHIINRLGEVQTVPLKRAAVGRAERFSYGGGKQFLSYSGNPKAIAIDGEMRLESSAYCADMYVSNEGEFFGKIDNRLIHIKDGVFPQLAADAPVITEPNAPTTFECLGESDKYIVFKGFVNGNPKIYIKETGAYVSSPYAGGSTTVGADGYLYAHSGTKIYRSEDAEVWTEVAEGMHEMVAGHRILMGDGFMLSINESSTSFKFYECEISTVKPQAKIRMLKEVI